MTLWLNFVAFVLIVATAVIIGGMARALGFLYQCFKEGSREAQADSESHLRMGD